MSQPDLPRCNWPAVRTRLLDCSIDSARSHEWTSWNHTDLWLLCCHHDVHLLLPCAHLIKPRESVWFHIWRNMFEESRQLTSTWLSALNHIPVQSEYVHLHTRFNGFTPLEEKPNIIIKCIAREALCPKLFLLYKNNIQQKTKCDCFQWKNRSCVCMQKCFNVCSCSACLFQPTRDEKMRVEPVWSLLKAGLPRPPAVSNKWWRVHQMSEGWERRGQMGGFNDDVQTSLVTFWLGEDQLVTEADNPWKIWFYQLKSSLHPPAQTVITTAAHARVYVVCGTRVHGFACPLHK